MHLLSRPFLLLAALAFVVWWPALLGDTVYDDVINLQRNPALREGDVLALVREPFFREHMHYWRPLTQLVFAATLPWGMVAIHLGALVLHVTSAWIALRIVSQRFAGTSRVAAVVGLLFLAHPVHAESVAWASALPDVLAGTLSLAALYWALAGTARGCWLAAGLFGFALLAKEGAVAMLPVLVAAPWCVRAVAASPVRPWLRHAVPIVAVVLVWWVVRHQVLGANAATSSTSSAASIANVLVASAEVFVRQVLLLPVPWPLSPFRHGPVAALSDPLAVASVLYAVGALAILVASAVVWMRVRQARVAVLLVVVPALLPALAWPSLGEFCIQDRYVYLGVFGLGLLSGPLLARWAGVAVAVLCALASLSHVQARIWRDQESLVEHALAAAPNLATPHVMAGDLAIGAAGKGVAGALDRASQHYSSALRAELPREPLLGAERRAGALLGLGWCDFLSPGTEFPRDAERVAAKFRAGLAEYEHNASGWVGLGTTQALGQDRVAAERSLRRATTVDPRSPEAWFNLGVLQSELGAVADARRSFTTALRFNPDLEAARQRLLDLQGR